MEKGLEFTNLPTLRGGSFYLWPCVNATGGCHTDIALRIKGEISDSRDDSQS